MKTNRLQICSIIILISITLSGCDKRANIGSDYELRQPRTYLIDSGSPAVGLYYKGGKVWRSVLMGDDKTCHDDIFVFMSTVPDSKGGCNVSPQLFAIRGEEPPVILSERILNQPYKDYSHQPLANISDSFEYELDYLTPISNGVRAVFNVGLDKNDGNIMATNDVLWPDIENWMREAETSAPVQIAPLGNYRILPMKQPK